FTHWSYENERYVRPCVQQEATALLTSANFSWDLIFGHHPHVRQPMMRINDARTNKNKLVLFSGGNFTSGVRFIRASKHLYGIIMKCKIGPLSSNQNQLAIGDVEWRRTYNRRDVISDRPTKTIIIDRTNEPNPLRYSPIVGIILIIVIIILKILEYFVF
ncbi:MAG: CapA family protein, partial [Candidatus Thorarchaeota archaeon]